MFAHVIVLGTISVTPRLLLRVVPDSGHGAADFPCRYSLERRRRGLQRRAGLVCHCSKVVSGAGPAGGQSGRGGSWLPGRGVQARHRSPSHRSPETAQVCVCVAKNPVVLLFIPLLDIMYLNNKLRPCSSFRRY